MVLFCKVDGDLGAFPPPYRFSITAHEIEDGGGEYRIIGKFIDHKEDAHLILVRTIEATDQEDADKFAKELMLRIYEMFLIAIEDRRSAVMLDTTERFNAAFEWWGNDED